MPLNVSACAYKHLSLSYAHTMTLMLPDVCMHNSKSQQAHRVQVEKDSVHAAAVRGPDCLLYTTVMT